MNPLAESLARSPERFPILLDLVSDRVSLADLSEQDYASASFLDERLQKPSLAVSQIKFRDLQTAVTDAGLDASAHFIFHISHVGSTLLSRLLGAHPGVFALRQPGIFRALIHIRLRAASAPPHWRDDQFDARYFALLKLWSRTFRPSQSAVIKMTSFVSELAELTLSRPYCPRAIFMFLPAEQYLANILRSERSTQEMQTLAPMRQARLNNRLGAQFKLQPMSIGEIVAMSWASEMVTLIQTAKNHPDRIFWLNFDNFLAEPHVLLARCFAHLEIDAAPDQIESILAGPDMLSYSKAPGTQYDAAHRETVLAQSRQTFDAEIRRGMQWLDNAAAQYAPLRQAIELVSATPR